MQGFIGGTLGHGDRNRPERGNDLGAETGGTDLHPLELIEGGDGTVGVEEARAVGMKIEHLDSLEFLGVEDPEILVGHGGGDAPVGIADGEIEDLHDGKAPPGISEA